MPDSFQLPRDATQVFTFRRALCVTYAHWIKQSSRHQRHTLSNDFVSTQAFSPDVCYILQISEARFELTKRKKGLVRAKHGVVTCCVPATRTGEHL